MLDEYDLFGEVPKQEKGIIRDKYMIPPFTVLSARDGDWQDRKRQWIRMGLESELGRDATVFNIGNTGTDAPEKKEAVSIFDPVLCELLYKWFCPIGGQVVDPFAGGSVRGVVASTLGYKYWGCDIRNEQIEENYRQASYIGLESNLPVWLVGDAMHCVPMAPESDFFFSCPPYGDLEVYSDIDGDISNMDYHAFVAAYKRIILRGVGNMRNDSFACFVVGEFRDRKGIYRGFVPETINAFESAGARLYNEAILVTAVASTSMRLEAQFDASRKMGKTHQNILVFVKGDPKTATGKIKDSQI